MAHGNHVQSSDINIESSTPVSSTLRPPQSSAPPPAHTWIAFPKTPKPITFKHGEHKYAILPAPDLHEYYALEAVDKNNHPTNEVSAHPPTSLAPSAAAENGNASMSEPRVRLTRHHAQLNFGNERMFILSICIWVPKLPCFNL